MTLATRLTAFALAGLAVVLAGFSVALHELVGRHLRRELDDRLTGTLHLLTAAAEISDEGVEWEPAERRLGVGDGIAWLVTDPAGRVIDRGGAAADFLDETAARLRVDQASQGRSEWRDERWQVRQVWVEPGLPTRPPVGRDKDRKFPTLGLTVATSEAPVRQALRDLALVLTGLSVGTWLIALAAGRAVCRWALRPVTRMAADARGMDAADLGRRLPVAPSGDELTALGREFNALLGRVQEAFERQRRFAGDASHQLRTPLTALLGQVEVALRRDRSPDEYKQTLSAVRGQADRLRQIVESLLFLTRADAEARLPDREPHALDAWLAGHVRTAWGDHPRFRDIRVEARPVTAAVHPVLLGELVNVLIDNACKYSPPGTPILVRVGPAGDGVELSVEDAGSGVAAADLEQIFDPFVRSADARRTGVDGIGLGLSVARRIAAAHGGTLAAVSGAARGATFTLRLPTS